MKLNITKILSAVLLPCALFLSSCDDTDAAAQKGFVELQVKRTSSGNIDGYQTYRFNIPPYGMDKIYAGKCTADDNSNVEQYIIRGFSAEDTPFDAIEVHLIPGNKAEGYAPKATVRVGEYRNSYTDTTTEFFWTITEKEHGLNSTDYSVPMAEGGILTCNFQTSADDGVYEAGYNNNTSNYPLLSLKVAAPVQKY